MKMTRKEFLQTILAGGLAVAVGKTTGCDRAKPASQAENPYAYDIDQFKKVENTLIAYRESDPLPFADAPLKSIAVTADDQLLVATEKRIHIHDPDLTRRSSFPVKRPPYALAALSAKAIYVAFRDQIQVFNAQGKVAQTWNSLGESAVITGLDVNQKHVVAADYGNKQLWLFDTQGNLKRFIGIKSSHGHPDGFKIPSPYFDARFDPNGSIWVANTGMLRLENYATNGALKSFWGKPGMALERFSGCCNPTHFALLPQGGFVTVEKGLVRIKVHEPDGALRSVVAPPDAFSEGLTGVDLAANSQGTVYAVDRFKKQVRIFKKK